jgi:integrase
MPRKAIGSVYWSRGVAFARLTLDRRVHVKLATCTTEEEAAARTTVLAEMAASLRASGHGNAIGEKILKRAGGARDGKPLEDVREAVQRLASKQWSVTTIKNVAPASTFEDVARLWTSGEIARRFPDYVKTKRTVESDEHRLKHILPVAGDVEIAAFGLEDADRVMAMLPSMSVASRRHVAQVIHRVLALAVFPLKLREAHPLPEGWLPKLGTAQAKAYLYPDEDGRLLACEQIPAVWRLLYGFLHREGMRRSEALSLQWRDLDLRRGAVVLDKNKTNDPRAWALRPDVVEALCAWWLVQGQPAPDGYVFVDNDGHRLTEDHTADRYRADLDRAGIDRPQLFETSTVRRRIRFHDTRATFVTLALANGKTEAWITARTGHKSSDQIAKYRRTASTVNELDLGDTGPLFRLLPELRFFPGRESVRSVERAAELVANRGNSVIVGGMPGIQVPAGLLPWGFKSPPSHKKSRRDGPRSGSVDSGAATSSATTALSGLSKGIRVLGVTWDAADASLLAAEGSS